MRKGQASAIGAIFLVLIALMGLTYVLWSFNELREHYDKMLSAQISREERRREGLRLVEAVYWREISVATVTDSGLSKFINYTQVNASVDYPPLAPYVSYIEKEVTLSATYSYLLSMKVYATVEVSFSANTSSVRAELYIKNVKDDVWELLGVGLAKRPTLSTSCTLKIASREIEDIDNYLVTDGQPKLRLLLLVGAFSPFSVTLYVEVKAKVLTNTITLKLLGEGAISSKIARIWVVRVDGSQSIDPPEPIIIAPGEVANVTLTLLSRLRRGEVCELKFVTERGNVFTSYVVVPGAWAGGGGAPPGNEGFLEIISYTAPSTVNVGETFAVTVTVRNLGANDTVFVELWYDGTELDEEVFDLATDEQTTVQLQGSISSPGVYTLTIKAGHLVGTDRVVDDSRETTIQVIVPTYVLSVYVKDTEDYPLQGYPVVVDGSTKYTDASGLAQFTLSQGSYTVSLESSYSGRNFARWSDGVTTPTRTIILDSDKELLGYYKTITKFTDVSVVRFLWWYIITGYLKSEHDNPLAGKTVILRCIDRDRTTTTGADGSFTFTVYVWQTPLELIFEEDADYMGTSYGL